jgi:hypothetical protein
MESKSQVFGLSENGLDFHMSEDKHLGRHILPVVSREKGEISATVHKVQSRTKKGGHRTNLYIEVLMSRGL